MLIVWGFVWSQFCFIPEQREGKAKLERQDFIFFSPFFFLPTPLEKPQDGEARGCECLRITAQSTARSLGNHISAHMEGFMNVKRLRTHLPDKINSVCENIQMCGYINSVKHMKPSGMCTAVCVFKRILFECSVLSCLFRCSYALLRFCSWHVRNFNTH